MERRKTKREEREVYPQSREGERGNSENISALSAGAYNTT
jgi:hypothetical protein